MKLITVVLTFLLPYLTWSLTDSDLASIESETLKYISKKGVTLEEKYKALTMLAQEMESYEKNEKAEKYYLQSLESLPEKKDPIMAATSYLSLLYKRDMRIAEKFYKGDYQNFLKKSFDEQKEEISGFWGKVFNKDIQEKEHKGFYGHFFKKRDIKTLIEKGNYKKALDLISPKQIENADILEKLEYDVLTYLNGKKEQFYCEKMLNEFPNSYDPAMDICRMILKKQLKNNDLQKVIEEETPHLSYLFLPLIKKKGAK